MILDDESYDKIKEDSAIKNANLEQTLALMQADTQEHIASRQQEAQQ